MNIGTLVTTSGPIAVFAAFGGFFVKAYLEKRKGDREDRKIDRESESGIVETTREALRIVRKQMRKMDEDARTLQSQLAELKTRLREKDEETQGLRSQIEVLEARLRDHR